MKTFIHPTDIPVIAKIFNPISDTIFVLTSTKQNEGFPVIPERLDCSIRFFTSQQLLIFALNARPDQSITVFNLDTLGIETSLVAKFPKVVLIDLCGKKETATSLETQQFNFINNDDGTIRWIYNHLHQKPIFLNLYNNSGWKGKLYSTTFKMGYQLGLKNLLKSGAFWVTAKEFFLNENYKGNYAIFTGEFGLNRKAVVSFEQGQKATKFLKIPLTESAKKTIRYEFNCLQQLQSYKLRKIIVPKPKMVGTNLMVSNIRPEEAINNTDLRGLHLLALQELYQQTATPTLLNQSKVWFAVQKDLEIIGNRTITNDLSKEKVNRIYHLLTQLVQQLTTDALVPMSIAHGDLTPWNSYLTEKAVHIYDWEYAERLPLFYDAFNYIFQSSILIKQLPFTAIERQITAFAKIPIVETMIREFAVNYELVYQFYLLRNTSFYLSSYVRQPNLPTQAYLMVNIWLTALEEITYLSPSKEKTISSQPSLET